MGGKKGPPPSPPSQSCEDLIFSTTLQSPDLSILGEREVGDVLNVTLHDEAGVTSVIATDNEGQYAGAIASTFAPRLRNCIRQGFSYDAEIIELDEAYCAVSVWCTGQP